MPGAAGNRLGPLACRGNLGPGVDRMFTSSSALLLTLTADVLHGHLIAVATGPALEDAFDFLLVPGFVGELVLQVYFEADFAKRFGLADACTCSRRWPVFRP